MSYRRLSKKGVVFFFNQFVQLLPPFVQTFKKIPSTFFRHIFNKLLLKVKTSLTQVNFENCVCFFIYYCTHNLVFFYLSLTDRYLLSELFPPDKMMIFTLVRVLKLNTVNGERPTLSKSPQ